MDDDRLIELSGRIADLERGLERLQTIEIGSGTWASYTPVWTASTTNPTLGDGTLTGRHTQIGKLATVVINLTIGSTTNIGSGIYAFSLPITKSGSVHIGLWWLNKPGVGNYVGNAYTATSTTVSMVSDLGYVSSTAPVAPASSTAYRLTITYETV